MDGLHIKFDLGLKYRFGIKITVRRRKRNTQQFSGKGQEIACGSQSQIDERLEKDFVEQEKPHIGQFWPVSSVIADPARSQNRSAVAVLILGEEIIQENEETDCTEERNNGEDDLIQPSGQISLTEKSYMVDKEKGDTTSFGASSYLDSSKCSTTIGKSSDNVFKKRRFKSSTAIPLTAEEIAALELDIGKPLDVPQIIRNKYRH